jgi:hypothetical protein
MWLRLDKALDGVRFRLASPSLDGAVDHTISTYAEDLDKLQGIVVDESSERRGSRAIDFRRHIWSPVTRGDI